MSDAPPPQQENVGVLFLGTWLLGPSELGLGWMWTLTPLGLELSNRLRIKAAEHRMRVGDLLDYLVTRLEEEEGQTRFSDGGRVLGREAPHAG